MKRSIRNTVPFIEVESNTNLKNYCEQMSSLSHDCIKYKTSLVRYHGMRLGRQKYCYSNEYRYWVWEYPSWTVFVSNKRGVSFEVISGLTPEDATKAFDEYIGLIS